MNKTRTNPRLGARGVIKPALVAPILLLLGIVGYVVVAGSTGFCPTCSRIMGAVLGESRPASAPASTDAPGDFASLTFHDLDGTPVSMDRYLGRPLVVELWATWCAPCIRNRKVLFQAQDRLAEHAGLVSLSIDQGGAPAVRAFLEKEGKTGSKWTELLATDPRFRSVIRSLDRRPTIPKLIYVSPRGSVVDIEYGAVRPDWILSRVKAMSAAPGEPG